MQLTHESADKAGLKEYPTVSNWEYQIVVSVIDWSIQGPLAQHDLNWMGLGELGRQRWELVGIVPINAPTSLGGGTAVIEYHLKRQRP
jgi:hypothetical protein